MRVALSGTVQSRTCTHSLCFKLYYKSPLIMTPLMPYEVKRKFSNSSRTVEVDKKAGLLLK